MDVCVEDAKIPRHLDLTPKEGKDARSACGSGLHPDMAGKFQSVSAKGLVSCHSSGGFSPQGERRFLVPSERGGVMVMEGEEAGRRRLTSESGWHMGIPVSMCPAEDAQEASGPVKPGWTAGTGRQPCAGGGALRQPKGPRRRACSQRPPGCWIMSADAVCCDG